MSLSKKVTLNKTTPTLIFSGVGNVAIQHGALGGAILLGGSTLTQGNGYGASGTQLILNVTSPDEIYGLVATSWHSATEDVSVLEVR